jgi:16S rRNA (uracil1498-N3)-methyltransferase
VVAPLFFSNELANVEVGASFTLGGDEGKHASNVRRMRTGEAIQLTDGNGLRISGVITAVVANYVTLTIESKVTEAVTGLQLTLVQALAKGDRDELAVQAATELGASAVIPWQAKRSVSRWEGPKQEKGKVRWQSIATEAAKQSLRVFTPEVASIVSTKQLGELIPNFDQVLVLDPTATTSLVEIKATGRIAIVVGPEGGIDDSELSLFEQAGATRVHLGSGILRTSTAGLAAISYLVGVGGHWERAE